MWNLIGWCEDHPWLSTPVLLVGWLIGVVALFAGGVLAIVLIALALRAVFAA